MRKARLVVASRATVTSGKVVSSRVLRRARYRQVVAQRDHARTPNLEVPRRPLLETMGWRLYRTDECRSLVSR
jgi:hypothetical protein